MANSGDEIYAVHQCGGDCWEDAYDYVLAAFTSMPRAVSYIERDLGAYECSHGDSREWHRWSLCVFKGDEYECWGPMDDSEDEDDLDDEDDDFEPTHPSRVTEFGTRRHFRARRASGLVHGRFLERAPASAACPLQEPAEYQSRAAARLNLVVHGGISAHKRTEFGTRRHFRARRASGLVHGRFLERAPASAACPLQEPAEYQSRAAARLNLVVHGGISAHKRTEFGTRRHFRARRASGLVHGRFLEQAQANQLGKRGAQPSACSANLMYKREKSAGHTADGRNGAVCRAPGPASPSYPPVRLGCRHNSLPFAEKTAPSRVLLIVHLPFRNSLGVHFLNDCGGLCVCTAGLPGKRRPHPVDVLGPWGCPGSL